MFTVEPPPPLIQALRLIIELDDDEDQEDQAQEHQPDNDHKAQGNNGNSLKGQIRNTFTLAGQNFLFCFSEILSNDFHVALLESSNRSHCKYDFMRLFFVCDASVFLCFLLFFHFVVRKHEYINLFTR